MLDAASYGRLAIGIAEHGVFEQRGEGTPAHPQPATNYSPGLPLLVAGIYELSGGEHQRLARIALALIGSLAILFAYLIARRLAGPWAGIVAALAVAVYPAFLEYQGMLMTEPLAATLLSGSVLAVLRAAGREKPMAWALAGALFGLTAMVRPEYLAIGLLVALVVFARDARDNPRRGILRAGIVAGALLLVVAPWTIRNLVVLDRFVPLSTGGGQALFAGTYLPSDGDPQQVGEEVLARHPGIRARLAAEQRAAGSEEPPTLERVLALLAANRHPGVEADVALGRMGREQLWRNLRERPLRVAGFTAVKVGRAWGRGPRAVMTKPFWAFWQAVVVVFGLLGLGMLAWRRRSEALLFGVILLSVTLLSALLVASPRRVLVLVPLIAALAGYAAVSLPRPWRRPAPAR